MKTFCLEFKSVPKATISLFITLTIFFTLQSSLLSETYAANTVTKEAYAQFADNLKASRFIMGDGLIVLSGSLGPGSTPFCARALTIVAELADGTLDAYRAEQEQKAKRFCEEQEQNELLPKFSTAEADATRVVDPQNVLLLDTVKIDGKDILEELFIEATLPQNIIFSTKVTTLFDGGIFIATRAFSGIVLDSEGNELPNSSVGFGVFQTNSGSKLFLIITFAQRTSDFLRIESSEFDFSPVVGDGELKAEGLQIIATDAERLLNQFVNFKVRYSTLQTSFDTSNCPSDFIAKFEFDATLSNQSSMPLFLVRAEVERLSHGNVLQNADGEPGEAILTVSLGKDGMLSPRESVDVPFSICLKELNPFALRVNVLGLRGE